MSSMTRPGVFASHRFPERVRVELGRSFAVELHDSEWPPAREKLPGKFPFCPFCAAPPCAGMLARRAELNTYSKDLPRFADLTGLTIREPYIAQGRLAV